MVMEPTSFLKLEAIDIPGALPCILPLTLHSACPEALLVKTVLIE